MIKKSKKNNVKSNKSEKKKGKVIHRVIHSLSTDGDIGKKKIKKGVFFVAAIVFLLFLSFIAWICFTLPGLNDVKATRRTPMITVHDVNGNTVGVIGQRYGKPVDITKLPPYVAKLLTATEDKRFYAHGGIDVIGIFRALWVDVVSRSPKQGASTITAQLAKNLFLSSEKTLMRKIREMFLAIKIEHCFTKDEILEIYLNRVYFGAGVYGLDAAAAYYYGKDAYSLSLYESAVLIGMLKAPNTYSPLRGFKKSDERAVTVLKNAGFPTDAAKSRPVERKGNGWFFDYVQNEVVGYIGDSEVDIDVYTTYDPTWQKRAEDAVSQITADADNETAVMIMGYDGAIKAMIGGRDYKKSQFNRAVQAMRQPGSVFKPFVYLTALENGYTEYDLVDDKENPSVRVRNFDRKYRGTVSLKDALATSLNTVAVNLADDLGLGAVRKTAGKFGLSAGCADTAIIALGVCETSLSEITAAYAALANGGMLTNSYAITRIDASGSLLYKRKHEHGTRIASENAVKALDGILAAAVMRGTGRRAAVPGLNIRGKTGTTQNGRDAWFVGYDDRVVVGVWTGYDDDRNTKITGGGMPAAVFKKIMEAD